MKGKRITFIVSEEMHYQFKGAAHDKKTTMTDILIKRIKEVIKESKEKEKSKTK